MHESITIGNENEKTRLDVFLTSNFPNKSRSFFQKIIKKGKVKVNEKEVNPKYMLKSGDIVDVVIDEKQKLLLEPEDIKLDIVYENSDIAIVNKPAGMVVHPSDEGEYIKGSLVNALLNHFGKDNLSDINGKLRPGIVHRLDKDTSGLLIIAKNNKIHNYIVSLLKERRIEKKYIALAAGKIKHEAGIIDSPVARSNRDRKKMSIAGENEGKQAVTEFSVKQYIHKDDMTYTLLDIQIHTGRTHQIRVHLSSIGHPVAGDSLYGNKKINALIKTRGLKRQFLHAAELTFNMPDGEKVHAEKELPEDLKEVLTNLA
jgi:23S rRNA pseudouridine1911/1915/1917 synthase